jgi:hypothetical protein
MVAQWLSRLCQLRSLEGQTSEKGLHETLSDFSRPSAFVQSSIMVKIVIGYCLWQLVIKKEKGFSIEGSN